MNKYIVEHRGPKGLVTTKEHATRAKAIEAFENAVDGIQGGHRLSLYSPQGSIVSRYEPVNRDKDGNIDTL